MSGRFSVPATPPPCSLKTRRFPMISTAFRKSWPVLLATAAFFLTRSFVSPPEQAGPAPFTPTLPDPQPGFMIARIHFDDRDSFQEESWPARTEHLKDLLNQTKIFWRSQTYGRIIGFQPPHFSELITIPRPETTGPEAREQIYQQVIAALKAQKADLSDIQHYILSYPRLTEDDTAWSRPGVIWLPGKEPSADHLIHEFGHSLGLGHIQIHNAVDSKLPSDLWAKPATDPSFMMGVHSEGVRTRDQKRFPPLPVPMRAQLGLISSEQVIEASQPGVYRIHAADEDSSMRFIALSLNVAAENGRTYWIGYYPTIKRTFGLPETDTALKGAYVHAVENNNIATISLRAPQVGADGSLKARFDTCLPLGETAPLPFTPFTLTPVEQGVTDQGFLYLDLQLSPR